MGAPGPHGSAIPVTYVPFRNAHFLSVAVSWAEAIAREAIYIGAVAEDSSGYRIAGRNIYRVSRIRSAWEQAGNTNRIVNPGHPR